MLRSESMIPEQHPLRRIKDLADRAMHALDDKFDELYKEGGRPSVPPERLLKALLLKALYTIRSERQLCEQLQYNFLYRWFLDMADDEAAFDATSFTKARNKGLFAPEVTGEFFAEVVALARKNRLLSEEHFSVDGTLIEAWASFKSFRPKEDNKDQDPPEGGVGPLSNRWVDFKGQPRKNDTHESKTDPDARMMRKGHGQESRLRYGAHLLMENRNGLIVDVETTHATASESDAALRMLKRQKTGTKRRTVGADRGYNNKKFVAGCRSENVTPHLAATKHSQIDGRVTRHEGYVVSQRKRMWIECNFGWAKLIGGVRKVMVRGKDKVTASVHMAFATLNLLRIAKLTSHDA